MAKARTLDKRRKSVSNIRKMTHTMELVSTAQFRRSMARSVGFEAYMKRIARLVSKLVNVGTKIEHPLFIPHESTKKALLFILTANNGLCGGYNAGVLRAALDQFENLSKEYDEVELFVFGKRGISYLDYRGYEIARQFTEFDHNPAYENVLVLANECLTRYKIGEIDRFDVVYSRFVSISQQYPTAETLLPLSDSAIENDEEGFDTTEEQECEFLPSPESILEEVVPDAFRLKLFKCFLEAAVSEQVARMMAMKAATENADSMISELTTMYNRVRQTQITNEIIEVINGAAALQ
jgi:F-type H+-transporting ATPase subunit gamma